MCSRWVATQRMRGTLLKVAVLILVSSQSKLCVNIYDRKPIQHLPVMQLFTADIFVQSESNSCMRWWRWLPCKVLTSTSGAVWGSVSCPKTLADQGNPWATDTHNHHTHFFWAIHTSGGHRGTLECIGSHTSGLFGEYYHHHLHHIHIVSIVFFFLAGQLACSGWKQGWWDQTLTLHISLRILV